MQKTPERVTINTLDDLPNGLLEEHGNFTMATDIMYINKIPFIITLSRAIQFGTIEKIKDKRKSTIIKSLQQIINTYHAKVLSYDTFSWTGNSNDNEDDTTGNSENDTTSISETTGLDGTNKTSPITGVT